MAEQKSAGLNPCAKWTPDCQGKWDYDGRLISISTRYWPARYQANGLPSAKATIVLNHGEPDEYGFGGHSVLWEEEFEGKTETKVKWMVEAWVQGRFNSIQALFAKTLAQHSKD